MTNYTGHDLIFAAAAPGSKWSRVLSKLSLHPSINNSDKYKYPTYKLNSLDTYGTTKPVGNHTGVYFGPGNGVGENFDDLTRLTKEQFIDEIKPSFADWEQGIKIVKSHWFSYYDNLNWLIENFPDAKLILVYNGNDVAFKWWHYVGGWDISFPSYTWYENDQRMYDKILEENHYLLKFAKKHLIPIRMYNYFTDLLQELELSSDLDFINHLVQDDIELIKQYNKSFGRAATGSFSNNSMIKLITQFNNNSKGSAIGVFSNNSIKCKNIEEFENHLSESDILLTNRHKLFEIDQLLVNKHNTAWLEKIDDIIAATSFTDK
jgi:hypothetical protein